MNVETDSIGFSPSTTHVGLHKVFEPIGNDVCRIISPTIKTVSRHSLSLCISQTSIQFYILCITVCVSRMTLRPTYTVTTILCFPITELF